MTVELEFTGRNVDKAVQQAAKKLKVPIEAIRYEILSHGSTGIFGLAGVKKARIRVRNHHADRTGEKAAAVDKSVIATKRHDELEPETPSLSMEEGITIGQRVLRRMVDAISPEATIAVERDEQQVRFVVEGGQSGVLIGKRGQTLEALQVIVEKAVRRVNGHDFRLQVDVEGYLAKKQAGLVNSAERLAQKVAAKGNPSSMGYLNAQDRRLVHLALKERRDVRTKSVGEGTVRKLMIYPRQKPQPRG